MTDQQKLDWEQQRKEKEYHDNQTKDMSNFQKIEYYLEQEANIRARSNIRNYEPLSWDSDNLKTLVSQMKNKKT